jgi:flagellar biosynthesis protein FlhG
MRSDDRGASVSSITPRRRVIAVTGGKGGVGKSTVALNLAASYAVRGAKVMIVDGDMGMADLNLMVGIAPANNILDLLLGYRIEDVLVAAHGMHILPALNGSYHLANLDAQSRQAILQMIASQAHRFDTLVIDTPAGIGENSISLAGAASEVVVVATPDPVSLADAYACLKVLALREGVTQAFVVPNNIRTALEAEEVFVRLSGLATRFLGMTLVPLPHIPFDLMSKEAAAFGTPLVMHTPDAPASRAIRTIARRLDALSRPSGRPCALARFMNPTYGVEPLGENP